MADASVPHVRINLIGKPKESLTSDFLKWAISAGRIIIVVTELIALSALLYRFTLDRKIIDLHDQIKNASLFVNAQEAKEADYRSIQGRLDNIKLIKSQTDKKVAIINEILEAISSGNFSATNLSIDQKSININGLAYSIFPINDFIDLMKNNKDISSISLDDVASTAQGVQFKMAIELK